MTVKVQRQKKLKFTKDQKHLAPQDSRRIFSDEFPKILFGGANLKTYQMSAMLSAKVMIWGARKVTDSHCCSW